MYYNYNSFGKANCHIKKKEINVSEGKNNAQSSNYFRTKPSVSVTLPSQALPSQAHELYRYWNADSVTKSSSHNKLMSKR